MVGLSIVLESSLRNNNNNNGKYNKNIPQVINKATMIKPSPPPCRRSSPAAGFLDRCFLCGRKLLAGKDIYMYKGDKAFCSLECRSNQILMDEEETNYNSNSGFKRDNCSLTSIKGANSSSQSSSSSSSSRRNHKGASTKNGANGFVF